MHTDIFPQEIAFRRQGNININQSRPSTLTLNARSGNVGMDQAVYVNTTDSLDITVISSLGADSGVVLKVDLRMLTAANGLQYLTYTIHLSEAYVSGMTMIKVAEGFLLSASIYAEGQFVESGGIPQTPGIGQIWASIEICETSTSNETGSLFLTQGYVTNVQRISWPFQQQTSYADGYAFCRPIGIELDAVHWAYQVPSHAVDEITGVTFSLYTGITVGRRDPIIGLRSAELFAGQHAALSVFLPPFQPPFDASGAGIFYAAQGFTPATDQASGIWKSWGALPSRLRLAAGGSVEVGADGAQAGDVLRDAYVWGNEWLVP